MDVTSDLCCFVARVKHKTEEASRSEAKFLKMKAWSKSRIRQLEEELKRSQVGPRPPSVLHSGLTWPQWAVFLGL